METHIPAHRFLIGIGVAVAAQVAAGIVLTNIVRDVAGTLFAVFRIGRKDQILSNSLFKNLLCHASRTICADR